MASAPASASLPPLAPMAAGVAILVTAALASLGTKCGELGMRRRRRAAACADGAPGGHFEVLCFVRIPRAQDKTAPQADAKMTTAKATTKTVFFPSVEIAEVAYISQHGKGSEVVLLLHQPKRAPGSALFKALRDALAELQPHLPDVGDAFPPPFKLFPVDRRHRPIIAGSPLCEGMLEAGEAYLKDRDGDCLRTIELVVCFDGKQPPTSLPAEPAPFPVAGIALPILGHGYLGWFGSFAVPSYNIAANLFPPSGKYPHGATVRLRKASPGLNDFGDDDNSRLHEVFDDICAGDVQARRRAEGGVIAAGFPPGTAFHPDAEDFVTLTADAEVVRELLARRDDFPKLWNRPAQLNIQRFTENGLFTSSETSEDWHTAHALLPRAFNEIRIRQYASTIIRKTGVFIEQWATKLAQAKHETGNVDASFNVEDMPEFLTAMTADAVVECSMGLDLKNVERIGAGEPAHDFVRLFRFCFGHSIGMVTPRSEYGWRSLLLPGFGAARLEGAFRAAKRELESMVEDMVETARTKGTTDAANKHSVIWSMLDDRASNTGKRVRLRAIFGHVMNLMIAGHETTAATLGFTMQLIAEHPLVEARCLEEARRVLNGKATLEASDVPKLTYIECVFREALRLYSPVVELTRDAAHDTVLAGHRIFQGERVSVLTRALHTNPEYWGGEFGDPREFNPDRFSRDAVAKRHPNAYHPWGFGTRACIGSQFAIFEAKSFLALLLVHFKWTGKPGYRLMPALVKGNASPNAKDLAFEIKARPGGPLDKPLHMISRERTFGTPAKAPRASATDKQQHTSSGATAAPPPLEDAVATTAQGEKQKRAVVLFGSNAGASEQVANEIAHFAAAHGLHVEISTLDAAVAGAGGKSILSADILFVATSTYNGTPPDNAKLFLPWLKSLCKDDTNKKPLDGVQFAVFGLGNAQWRQTYQKFPHEVDVGLANAGAARLVEQGAADFDGDSVEDSFEAWLASVGTALGTSMAESADAAEKAMEAERARIAEEASKLEMVDAVPEGKVLYETAAEALETANNIIDGLLAKTDADTTDLAQELEKDRIFPLRVYEPPRELCAQGCGRSVSHVTLELTRVEQQGKEEGQVPYRAGDHLEILPCNSADLIDMTLDALGIEGDAPVAWRIGRGSRRQARGANQVLSTAGDELDALYVKARTCMAFFADLASPPSKACLAKIAEHAAGCPKAIAELAALAQDGARYNETVGNASMAEVLSRYRGRLQLPLGLFVALVKPMAPRFYSISSSPAALSRPTLLTLTVARVSYTTKTGRIHRGLASSLLGDAQPPTGDGCVLGAVRRMTAGFCVPEDARAPLVMVGPGTGIAPMMAFLQERRARRAAGESLGAAILFFGCRTEDDYLYKDELAGMLSDGTLTGLHVAYSRASGTQKVYVQDLIEANAHEVWSLMKEPSCRIFVCGDARSMAPSVRQAFCASAESGGGLTRAGAVSLVESIAAEGRYLEDVWAG